MSTADGVMLRTAVLCDSARTENTGKRILIGCYDMGVILHRKPTIFSGRIIGAFEILTSGVHRVEYRVRGPSFEGEGAFETESSDDDGGFVPFEAPFQTIVEDDGIIVLDWRIDDREWSRPVRWNLAFSQSATELPKKEADELRSKYWGPNWPEVRKAMKAASARAS